MADGWEMIFIWALIVYFGHRGLVTNGRSLGVGNNSKGRINSSLLKIKISHFTEFSINDDSGRQLSPVTAVCCFYSTLYMFSKISRRGRQLVYCNCKINGGNPVFLDISDDEPVSLFVGFYQAATISGKGDFIFINPNSVENQPC